MMFGPIMSHRMDRITTRCDLMIAVRLTRDSLLERVIATYRRSLRCATNHYRCFCWPSRHAQALKLSKTPLRPCRGEDALAVRMFAALVQGDHVSARAQFSSMLESIRKSSLLYIPLSRGGDPVKIFLARLRQRMLHHLLHRMPRSGLLVEACRLVESARLMEQHNPIGGGAVTEFDNLFRIGFRSLVVSLVASVILLETDGTRRTNQAFNRDA